MIEEEAQHFPRRVRPLRIGVGAGGTASRPGVAGTVDIPVLGDRRARPRRSGSCGYRHARRVLVPRCTFVFVSSLRGLLDNSVAVVRMHGGVAIAMENDGRHGRSAIRNCLGPPPCRMAANAEGRSLRGAARQARMDPDGRVQIGVRRPHDGRGGPAGRQARDVDALRIDRIVPHDLPGDAGDQRRFAPVPLLVARAKPVPAFRLVGSAAAAPDRPRSNSALPP